MSTAPNQSLHLTRAFGALGIAAFLALLVGLFSMVVMQIRRGQVSSSVSAGLRSIRTVQNLRLAAMRLLASWGAVAVDGLAVVKPIAEEKES